MLRLFSCRIVCFHRTVDFDRFDSFAILMFPRYWIFFEVYICLMTSWEFLEFCFENHLETIPKALLLLLLLLLLR